MYVSHYYVGIPCFKIIILIYRVKCIITAENYIFIMYIVQSRGRKKENGIQKSLVF